MQFYVVLQDTEQQYETCKVKSDKKRKRSSSGTDTLSLEERNVLHDYYCKRLKLTCNKICDIDGQQNAGNSEAEGMLAV